MYIGNAQVNQAKFLEATKPFGAGSIEGQSNVICLETQTGKDLESQVALGTLTALRKFAVAN